MNLNNLASCIEDLRRMEEKDPSAPIQAAITYLDIFLEKLCTHEIVFERKSYSTLCMNMIIYPEMAHLQLYEGVAMIKATLEWNLADALKNFGDAYGFEPVTLRETQRYFPDPRFVRKDEDLDQQATLCGYKLYKKAPDKEQFIWDRKMRYQKEYNEWDTLADALKELRKKIDEGQNDEKP